MVDRRDVRIDRGGLRSVRSVSSVSSMAPTAARIGWFARMIIWKPLA